MGSLSAMKIYTKTGDKGATSLFTGKRVAKSHELIETFGSLDELNSLLGCLIESLDKGQEPLKERIFYLQSCVFNLGTYFASEMQQKDSLKNLSSWVSGLEADMDEYDKVLKPLKNFILPGGVRSACLAHQARVCARKVERLAVSLGLEDELFYEALRFLNRLSDYFFMLARYLNHQAKCEEPIWKP